MAKRNLVLAVGSGADTPAPKGSSMEIAPVYAHADGTTYIHASGKVYFLTLPASSVSLTVGQYYRFTPRSPEGAAITAQITAGAGDMLFKDLVPVDPATLLPSADPGPAWFTALTGKQDTSSLAADTAAHVSDGSALDVAVAAKIAAFGGDALGYVGAQSGRSAFGRVPTRFTNLLPNPSLNANSTDWTSNFGTGGSGTATRTAAVGYAGRYGWVLQWTVASTATGTNTGGNNGPTGPSARGDVTAGKTYMASIYVESDTDADYMCAVNAYAGTTLLTQIPGAVVTIKAGKRRRLFLFFTAPATTTKVAVSARNNTSSQMGTGKAIVSAAMLTEGYELTPYRDGDDGDTGWDGALGASTSSTALTSTLSNFGNVLGDSMVQLAHGGGETFPYHLANVLGVPAYNSGRGGETSTGCAVRGGGLDLQVTLTGNQIPTTGSVVVTAVTPSTVYRPDATWNFYGKIAGVPGTLVRAITTGVWTFTRSVDGSVVDVLPGTSFETFSAIDYADFTLFWAGVNLPDATAVPRDYVAQAARAASQGKAFFAVSLLNNSNQYVGGPDTAGYTTITGINTTLKAIFGATFLDLRRYLIDNGLATAGISPTAGDTTAIGRDQVPPSLMHTDGIHLNDAGRLVAAKFIAKVLTARNVAVPFVAIPELPDIATLVSALAGKSPTVGVNQGMESGLWYATPCATVTTGIPLEATERAARMVVARNCTIDQLAVSCTVAGSAGALVRMGIRADAAGDLPGVLLADGGTVAATSTGLLAVTLGTPLVVTAGTVLWLTSIVQGGATTRPTLRQHSAALVSLGDASGLTALDSVGSGAQQTGTTTGALPSTQTWAHNSGPHRVAAHVV